MSGRSRGKKGNGEGEWVRGEEGWRGGDGRGGGRGREGRMDRCQLGKGRVTLVEPDLGTFDDPSAGRGDGDRVTGGWAGRVTMEVV
jgi:hypothetical protein